MTAMHFIDLSNEGGTLRNSNPENLLSLWHIICSQSYMKQLYTLVFFLLVVVSYGQNSKANSDIDGFKLYPNPVTNSRIYITTMENGPKNISIFDVLGTKVLESRLIGKELNLSSLDAGVYLLRVYENNKVATRKLIIK